MLASVVGFAAGILTTVAIVPEIARVSRTGKADGLSNYWLATAWTGVAAWTLYGYQIGNTPLILFNLLSCILYSVLILMKLGYSSKRRKR